MSKTAEQVAEHTFFKETRSVYDSVPCLIVSALRSAGWLREPTDYSQRLADNETIQRLTRERDEARAGARNYWRSRYEEVFGELAEARATQSSPEVLAAAKALREEAWYYRGNGVINKCIETFDAALAAVERKAEPKPLERWCVVDGECHYTHETEATARQHAKERGGLRVVHLREVNAADAAGRKS